MAERLGPQESDPEHLGRDGTAWILFALAANPDRPVPCLFDTAPAAGVWYLDDGCWVYSGLEVRRIQPLCLYHENKASPQGGMELVADLADATSTPAASIHPTLPSGFTVDDVKGWLAARGLDTNANPIANEEGGEIACNP